MKLIPRLTFTDEIKNLPQALRLIQDNIINNSNAVLAVPIVDGVLITTTLTTTFKRVTHGLKDGNGASRKWRGYLVCAIDGFATVCHDASTAATATAATDVTLKSSASVTVTLWVF